MSTLQIHLGAGDMARLIDGGTVEIETNGVDVVLTGTVPDWEA